MTNYISMSKKVNELPDKKRAFNRMDKAAVAEETIPQEKTKGVN